MIRKYAHSIKVFTTSRNRILLLIIVFAIACIAGGVAYALVNHPAQLAEKPSKKPEVSISRPKEKEVAQSIDIAAASDPAATHSEVTNNPAPAQSAPTSSQAPANAPQRATGPPSVPFTISSVSIEGSQSMCVNDRIVFQLSSASALTQSMSGGALTWRIEVTDSAYGNLTLPTQSGSLVANQFKYYFANSIPGQLYEDVSAIPGQSARVHVLSPNDVASSWVTVPDNVCPQ